MNDPHLSRRHFTRLSLLSGAGLLAGAARPPAQSNVITARQVVERIQTELAKQGIAWRAQTVDTFKAGDPDTRVKGIATTFMATLDVLQRAAAAGKNLVITHEPTFWNHFDSTQEFADDPIFKHKMDFIAKRNLVVWRFHDHIHARKPDTIFMGLTKRLGWERYITGDNPRRYVMPETTLAALAGEAQSKLKSGSVRVIGDPQLKVTRVSNASHSLDANIAALGEADVILVGEAREWDSIEYLRDLTALGHRKGMILIAHQTWEEWGMEDCAVWLRTLAPEIPCEWIPAGEPFWTLS
jgi:putative NIF3 family GTP cyclohydrolase 1 type 2